MIAVIYVMLTIALLALVTHKIYSFNESYIEASGEESEEEFFENYGFTCSKCGSGNIEVYTEWVHEKKKSTNTAMYNCNGCKSVSEIEDGLPLEIWMKVENRERLS